MNLIEIYLLLFTDSLVTNLVINPSSEIIIDSMQVFHSYNPYIIIVTATAAFTAASLINYLFGRLCYKILAPVAANESKSLENKVNILRKWEYIILLLSFVPFFGKFILLIAGFCRINIFKTIAISVLVKFIYYAWFVLHQTF